MPLTATSPRHPFATPRLLLSALLLIVLLQGCGTVQTITHDHSHNAGQPRKVVIFIDGTANDPSTTTNVRRLFDMIINQDRDDIIAYYAEGVGSGGRILGAATGWGMAKDIRDAYRFLATNHVSERDQLYLFGFSRGAFGARALLGMIDKVGLVRFSGHLLQDEQQQRKLVGQLYDIYKDPRQENVPDALRQQYYFDDQVRAKLLGIWDTVESQGARGKTAKDLYTTFHPYHRDGWCRADRVMHALSLDENRDEYTPKTIDPIHQAWQACTTKPDIQQVWFPGAHSDVGGGYKDGKELPGLSLNWMLEVLQGPEHRLVPAGSRVYENCQAPAHNAHDDNRIFRAIFDKEPRRYVKAKDPEQLLDQLHVSLLLKLRHDPSYRPAWLLNTHRDCFAADGITPRDAAGCFGIVGSQARCDGVMRRWQP